MFTPPSFLGTALNRPEKSRRVGIEGELGWAVSRRLRLTANYAYLKASEPDTISTLRSHETRRPKHSGSIGADGSTNRLTYGASIAYVGATTIQLDPFPFDHVALGSYWLADARIAYLTAGIELFVRMSNALNQLRGRIRLSHRRRAAYAGLRLSRL